MTAYHHGPAHVGVRLFGRGPVSRYRRPFLHLFILCLMPFRNYI